MSATSPLKVVPQDDRESPRKVLKLHTAGRLQQAELQLDMYNISHTGFLAKVTGDLRIGQVLDVELSPGMSRKATPVWLNNGLAGFTFLEPISNAAISSAFLRGDFTQTVRSAEGFDEAEIGGTPAAWNEVPTPEKYSLGVRILILMGLAIASWAAVVALLSWLL